MGVRALLVAVAVVLLSSSLSSSCEVPGPALSASERRARRTLDLSQVPDGEHTALVEVVATIDAGGPFAYRQDGTIFQNRERRLPLHPVGFWHEYTVPTPGSRDRGARRVVGGDDDSLFYTRNHYGSFVQIRDAANDNVEDAAAADPVGTTR